MKITFYALFVAALLVSSVSFATIRRVGYTRSQWQDNGITQDYSFRDAVDASADYDTIQLYGPAYGTVTKPLVIIGFGYNLDNNPGLQAMRQEANATLTFSAGSNGSIVSGIDGNFFVRELSGFHTPISNITFQRCNASIYFYTSQLYGSISDIKIISSVIHHGGMVDEEGNGYPLTNLKIYNCIFVRGKGLTLFNGRTTASIMNCVMPSPNKVPNGALASHDANVLVKNCIIGSSAVRDNSNTRYENSFFAEFNLLPCPLVVTTGGARIGL